MARRRSQRGRERKRRRGSRGRRRARRGTGAAGGAARVPSAPAAMRRANTRRVAAPAICRSRRRRGHPRAARGGPSPLGIPDRALASADTSGDASVLGDCGRLPDGCPARGHGAGRRCHCLLCGGDGLPSLRGGAGLAPGHHDRPSYRRIGEDRPASAAGLHDPAPALQGEALDYRSAVQGAVRAGLSEAQARRAGADRGRRRPHQCGDRGHRATGMATRAIAAPGRSAYQAAGNVHRAAPRQGQPRDCLRRRGQARSAAAEEGRVGVRARRATRWRACRRNSATTTRARTC